MQGHSGTSEPPLWDRMVTEKLSQAATVRSGADGCQRGRGDLAVLPFLLSVIIHVLGNIHSKPLCTPFPMHARGFFFLITAKKNVNHRDAAWRGLAEEKCSHQISGDAL